MQHRHSLVAAALAIVLLASAGCTTDKPADSTADRLLGTWYDNQTGAQYAFAADNVLVVPTAQPGNGNAVTYALLGDGRLDVKAGDSHRVSDIETLTATALVLADPITGRRQPMLRDPGATRYAAALASSALQHLSDVTSASASPDIVWVAPMPTGKGAEWVQWSPSTIDTYIQSWDWTGLRRTPQPIATSGGGPSMGYSFGVSRHVQSEATLTASWIDPSVEATAGLPLIDVGFSATKAEYPAGTLVSLPGGMIYSLGDGFAIAVGRDPAAKSFVPLTHK